MRIAVRKKICSGCLACELACVAEHEGVFGTGSARIRVTKTEWEGLDAPSVCRFCREPGCVEACPHGALYQEAADPAADGKKGGIIRLHEELCDLCGKCVEGCRYGGIFLHPETGRPITCDLCNGNPQCVRRCAMGAISVKEDSARKEVA